jgi:anthranilate phosphoribosyltransferase
MRSTMIRLPVASRESRVRTEGIVSGVQDPRPSTRDLRLVDTCGTGGGTATTFNISTTAAFVVAGAGVPVAKHGNRSFTSRSGSADVLEALGIDISLSPERAAQMLEEVGLVFLFAPDYHPAMRHAAPVRKELKTTTIFNLLGPLANPAGATRQVIGVSEVARGPVVAEALVRLGAEHALVVHAEVGMDEISPAGLTRVWEVAGRESRVAEWTLEPAVYCLADQDLDALRGGGPAENADRLERILADPSTDPAGRAAVLLNAAAAIYVSGERMGFGDAVVRAREALEAGHAALVLERLRS